MCESADLRCHLDTVRSERRRGKEGRTEEQRTGERKGSEGGKEQEERREGEEVRKGNKHRRGGFQYRELQTHTCRLFTSHTLCMELCSLCTSVVCESVNCDLLTDCRSVISGTVLYDPYRNNQSIELMINTDDSSKRSDTETRGRHADSRSDQTFSFYFVFYHNDYFLL